MELKGWIYAKLSSYQDGPEYQFWDGVEDDGGPNRYFCSDGRVPLCPYTITFDLPAEFNPVAAQINALREAQDEVRAEMTAKINALQEQILAAIDAVIAARRGQDDPDSTIPGAKR